jgi:hypothetical protein
MQKIVFTLLFLISANSLKAQSKPKTSNFDFLKYNAETNCFIIEL